MSFYWFDNDRNAVAVNDASEGWKKGWYTLFPVDEAEAPVRIDLSDLTEHQKELLIKLLDDLVYGSQAHTRRLQQTVRQLRKDLDLLN